MMSDFEPTFYAYKNGSAEGFVARRRGWGSAEPDPPILGEDRSRRLDPKTIRSSPDYRHSTVSKLRYLFTAMFQDESDKRHVPIHGSVGKMLSNLKFLRDQKYDESTLEAAWAYFKTQLDHMVLQGSSLWDEFFAHRMEAFKYAANASIGGRDAPGESLADFAKRKMLSQQKEAIDGPAGEG